jgi:hypothetical protein
VRACVEGRLDRNLDAFELGKKKLKVKIILSLKVIEHVQIEQIEGRCCCRSSIDATPRRCSLFLLLPLAFLLVSFFFFFFFFFSFLLFLTFSCLALSPSQSICFVCCCSLKVLAHQPPLLSVQSLTLHTQIKEKKNPQQGHQSPARPARADFQFYFANTTATTSIESILTSTRLIISSSSHTQVEIKGLCLEKSTTPRYFFLPITLHQRQPPS